MASGNQDDDPAEATGERRARRARAGPARRLLRAAGALASGALLLVILLVGGLWLRLAAGPIDLAPFLPRIEEAVSERLPTASVTVGAAHVTLDAEGGGASLAVTDATLIDDESGPFARAPMATASFALWDVLHGRIEPSDVTLTGVSGRLVREPSGAFRFGFGGLTDDEAGDGAGAFRRLMDSLDENGGSGGSAETALGDGPAGQRLLLRDASILYLDRLSGRSYRTKQADMALWRTEAGVAASADVVVGGGRNGAVKLSLDVRRRDDEAISATATFANAAPRDLAAQIPELDWLAALDAPLGGEIAFGMSGAGSLTALSGRMTSGAGRVTLGGEKAEPITSAVVDFAYQPETERFLIEKAAIEASRAALSAAGFVEVKRAGDGAPRDVVAQLDLADLRVTAPEFLDAPLGYEAGRLTGRVRLDPLLVEIGELRLEGAGVDQRMALSAAGRLWPDDAGWRAEMTASGGDFSLAAMMAHWPRQAAPGARAWMLENMEAAHVTDVDAAIRIGGAAEDDLKIDFTFEDAIGHYLRPMPPIRGGAGSGQVDLKRFALALDKGEVTVEGGEALDVAGSTFVIADLEHPETPGVATIVARGATADALALIDHEPLNLTSQLGVPLGRVGGRAEIRAVSTFPLLKDLLLEDVGAAATAALTDVLLVAPGLDRAVTAERLDLTADTSAFSLEGDAVVADLPATIRWDETFSPASREITARTRLTPDRLKRLGVEQDIFTDGAASVTATIRPDGETTGFSLSATLTDAALAVDEIGWRKAKGAKASVTAEGEHAGGALSLRAFDLASPDLIAVGAAELGADGAPRSVRLSRLRYRGAVDLAVTAERSAEQWEVAAEGPLLDLTGLEDIVDRAAAGDGDGSDPVRFRADLKIARLRLSENRVLSGVDGAVRREAGGDLVVKGTAGIGGGAPVSVDFRRGPNGGEAVVRVENAGRFMRDAGLFDDGSGGVMVVEARIAPGDELALEGQARVDDIVIHEDAKLEQILASAEEKELQEKMRRDGIVFDTVKAPFAYSGDTVTLNKAIAKGPFVGINISGDYNLESDRLDMNGVFSPFYRFNSALGKIPLLGQVLTGGDGQGVFAINFSVRGPADDPDISVNPLSALTPGVFRKIFDVTDGSQSADPQAPQRPRIGR